MLCLSVRHPLYYWARAQKTRLLKLRPLGAVPEHSMLQDVTGRQLAGNNKVAQRANVNTKADTVV